MPNPGIGTVIYFRYAEWRQKIKDESRKYQVLLLGDNSNIIVYSCISTELEMALSAERTQHH